MSYVVLLCASEAAGMNVHGLYATEAAAYAEIDRVEANKPIEISVGLQWTLEIRNEDEVRDLMLALNDRLPTPAVERRPTVARRYAE